MSPAPSRGRVIKMTFASENFLFYFFPIFLIIYFLFKGIGTKDLVFIIFSLLFYSASKPV